jgi:hypothetical protein
MSGASMAINRLAVRKPMPNSIIGYSMRKSSR